MLALTLALMLALTLAHCWLLAGINASIGPCRIDFKASVMRDTSICRGDKKSLPDAAGEANVRELFNSARRALLVPVYLESPVFTMEGLWKS
jgi:hypothetical protein